MVEEGIVSGLSGDKIVVRITRHPACGSCRLCSKIEKKFMQLELENSMNAGIGDKILLSLDDAVVVKAAFTAYVLPVVFLLIASTGAPAWSAQPPGDSMTIRADWYDRGNVRVDQPGKGYAGKYPCIWNAGVVPNRAEYDKLVVGGDGEVQVVFGLVRHHPAIDDAGILARIAPCHAASIHVAAIKPVAPDGETVGERCIGNGQRQSEAQGYQKRNRPNESEGSSHTVDLLSRLPAATR